MAQLLLIVALSMLAMAMVWFAVAYRSRAATPLPNHRPWIQWLPKYTFEVQLTSSLEETDCVRAEIASWLQPFGFDEASEATTQGFWNAHTVEGQLVFDRSRYWEVTNSGTLMRVVIETPLTNPCKVTILYRGGVIVDTGDLAAFGRELLDRHESAADGGDESAPLMVETGNPYQSPR